MAEIEFEWRGGFGNAELEALHARGFGYEPMGYDWSAQVLAHSLGWVTARRDGELVGFANVTWDGGRLAFILDVVVAPGEGRSGLGTGLVRLARGRAAEAGCEWLHVDFEEHLRSFYFGACGFTPTDAGITRLNRRAAETPEWPVDHSDHRG